MSQSCNVGVEEQLTFSRQCRQSVVVVFRPAKRDRQETRRNAATTPADSPGKRLLRNPITHSAVCYRLTAMPAFTFPIKIGASRGATLDVVFSYATPDVVKVITVDPPFKRVVVDCFVSIDILYAICKRLGSGGTSMKQRMVHNRSSVTSLTEGVMRHHPSRVEWIAAPTKTYPGRTTAATELRQK
jgi:hypothetical protein